jgi:chromosome segregation ATPase
MAQILLQEGTLSDLTGRLASLITAVGGMQTEFGVLKALYTQHREEEQAQGQQVERLADEFARLTARLEERERAAERWTAFGRWLLPWIVSIGALAVSSIAAWRR